MHIFKLLPLVVVASLGCSAGVAWGPNGFAADWSWIDLRVKEQLVTLDADGSAQVGTDKFAMSEQAAELAAQIIPLVVEGVVKGVCPITGVNYLPDYEPHGLEEEWNGTIDWSDDAVIDCNDTYCWGVTFP